MANIDPKAIQAHLSQYKGDKYVDGWASLWDKGDNLPWDRGFPNPALEDTLVKQRSTIGAPVATDAQGQSYRRKALVPGCGRGVDVLLLASFGYDAYGLEYSAAAVEACKKEENNNANWYRVRDETVGAGKVTWIQGDFFDDAWLHKIGVPLNGFDIIYDYTFFCALEPSMRPKWALRHTQLLAPSPTGNLICLEFPRHKDPQAAGPPFASPSEAYMAHLSHPGEEVPYDAKGVVKHEPLRAPSKAGLERVAYWTPERTHEVGQGENGVIHDRVSIWRRRN
ncbi:TPMT family [Penicillium cf. griseofulvum]|uniref:TPMT family n=1 Tax=Penicillium cf. griseofulvum TaxID=2972120 RepID=A0A9W9MRM0_9EURO|nr:TPMT family [Penicillium cf. griseofulvum]KAJ5440804.1 TPMT family [Penicillium cf. griseofulvum]KAJ5448850.1 TPMT family [Penicillium cf. griseofulvum]